MPTLIIIAGPNGAGKTTFAREYLADDERHLTFVNADEIARELARPSDIAAARLMLERIEALVAARADFAIETTLANLTYARKIPQWQNLGYRVRLIYLRLPSPAHSAARVRKRTLAGGHDIPVPVLTRRFARSAHNFRTVYQQLADEWYEWQSDDGTFSLEDSGGRHER